MPLSESDVRGRRAGRLRSDHDKTGQRCGLGDRDDRASFSTFSNIHLELNEFKHTSIPN